VFRPTPAQSYLGCAADSLDTELSLVLRRCRGLLVAAGIHGSLCEPHLTHGSAFFTTYMQGKPSCLTCPPPESHQPCTSNSDPRQPQTFAMAHIASCMRSDTNKSSVSISLETSSRMSVSHLDPALIPMNHHLPRRSCSLKDLQATRGSNLPGAPLTKSPSLATLGQPAASKYQLWPSAKSPIGLTKANQFSDKLAALAVGRSSTSLSDTAVLPESSLSLRQRTGSLSRRRKVSVPELGSTMTTVQELAIDSRKFGLKHRAGQRDR
jgi:hypothetical protein